MEVLQFVYDLQDPDSGLFGDPSIDVQNRINGAYKLFGTMRSTLDLPLPHADRMVDTVMDTFYDPDHDATISGCSEFDSWKVLHDALPEAGFHRHEEVARMALYRIRRTIETRTAPDGGLMHPDGCLSTTIGIDFAPPLRQGDAHSTALYTNGVALCVDVLRLEAGEQAVQGALTDVSYMRGNRPAPPEIRDAILARLRIPTT